FLFGIANSSLIIFLSFFLYGIYAAATEGVAKAWVTNLSQGGHTATAVGFYTACQSLGSLFASAFAGWLWSSFNSSVTFFTTSATAILVAGYFIFFLLAFFPLGLNRFWHGNSE